MKKTLSLVVLAIFCSLPVYAQVFWTEDFNAASPAWSLENTPGSKTNPTQSLTTNIPGGQLMANEACNNYWIINEAHTPQNSPVGPLSGSGGTYNSPKFVQGYRDICPAGLPNPDPDGGTTTNKSLHITFQPCAAGYSFGMNEGPPDYQDEYSFINAFGNGPAEYSSSDQTAYMTTNISTLGRCNLTLKAQVFMGGDMSSVKDYATLLYSIDGGATWKVANDPIRPASYSHFLAGMCNYWHHVAWVLPAECANVATLRFAFRWRNDANTLTSTGDYSLVSGFNIDNLALEASGPVADFNFGGSDQFATGFIYTTSICKMTNLTVIKNRTETTKKPSDNIVGYLWDIPGATYTGGTSATSIEPIVYFDESVSFGTIPATLNVIYGSVPCTTSVSHDIILNSCRPFTDFRARYTTLCATTPVPLPGSITIDTLIDMSSNPPNRGALTYAWSFPGKTVGVDYQYVNGTNASHPQPQVQFLIPGTYTVTLTTSNLDGAGSNAPVTKTSYITAVNCQCGTASAGSEPIVTYDFNSGTSGWTLNNPNRNYFIVDDNASGMPAGVCGAAGQGDPSLHITSTGYEASGAVYNAGSGSGATPSTATATSPLINTVGYTGIAVAFDFIGVGQTGQDRADFRYSIDGGTTWLDCSPTAFTTVTPAAPSGNMTQLHASTTGCGTAGLWTRATWNMPASCENITNLRIQFRWRDNIDGNGADPSFAVDDVTITGSPPPAVATVWDGTTSDWFTASNWTSGAVPDIGTSIEIPDPTTLGPGKFMPVINAGGAVALNVCNSGTLTLGNGATNHSLTIGGFLNNFGTITTTNNNPAADIIFAGTGCVYRGGGSNVDVDYQVGTGATHQLTLEAPLNCRSFNLANGTLNMPGILVTVKKDFTRAAGTTLTTNAGSILRADGPMAASWTNNYSNPPGAVITTQDVSTNQNLTFNAATTLPTLQVDKSAGTAFLQSNLGVSGSLLINNGTLDAQSFTLNGTATLVMNNASLLRLGKVTGVPTLPEVTGTYTLATGSRIELYNSNGVSTPNAQILRVPPAGSTPYRGLLFTNTQNTAVTRTLAGAITVTESCLISATGSAAGTNTVDAGTNIFSGNATLTMSETTAATCTLRVARTTASPATAPTVPELRGSYTLTGGTVLLDNVSGATAYQRLYAPATSYHRVVAENTGNGAINRTMTGNVTIDNRFTLVNTNTTANSRNTFDAGTNTLGGAADVFMSTGTSNPCTLRVAKTGVTLPEFTGTYTFNDRTTVANQPTVEFYADSDQTVRPLNNYRNLHFLGLGTKTIAGTVVSSGAAANTSEIVIDNGVVNVAGASDHLQGNSSLRMNGGRLEIATTNTTVPEVTGTYTLAAGRVVLDGAGAQTIQSSTAGSPTFTGNTYFDLEFSGSGVKTVEAAGDVVASNGLYLSLPAANGNYVNANGNTVRLTRNTATSLVRFPAGHVVGNLNRSVTGTNVYHYPVGSDLGPGTVYYEPLYFKIDNALTGVNDVTVAFVEGPTTDGTTSESGLPLSELSATYDTREEEGLWQLTPNAAPSGGSYSVEVVPSAGWVFSSPDRTLGKRVNGASPWAWAGSSPVSLTERSNYTSFSEISIISGATILPVEASPLTASPLSKAITVDWRTVTEQNNLGFDLERGLSADRFEKLTFIQGAGNSATPTAYNYIDYNVVPNVTYYYRYRSIDMDGHTHLSNVAQARLVENGSSRYVYSLYPNPAHAEAYFSLSLEEEATVHVAIFDATGRLIHTPMDGHYKSGQAGFTWQLDDVAPGMYLVRISVNGHNTTSKLVVR
ncbi:MAG: T9SS type A sorting domain-containing protein [Bacteroidetes bacterium]|nr:T9SS type A sorting domain-containing protein [Bacteroidota bacterium]